MKIKVLHISPNGELYGTERHILSILKYSNSEKFEHIVITPNRGNFNDIMDQLGIRYFIGGRPHGYKNSFLNLLKLKGFWDIYKIIKQNKFDIVHTHLNSYGGFIAKLAGTKKIFHTRHGVFWSQQELENISTKTRLFQKIKNKLFDITIAIGEYENNALIKYFGYNKEKIRLTYNGVEIDEINAKTNKTLNKKTLFGSDNFIVGAVGRLERQKGFDMMLNAAAEVVSKKNDIKFVIIGDGTLKGKLENMRKELNLDSNFDFIKYKNNIYDYINNFDLMVQTSLWEGISFVVLEAMALSKPVIALSTENTSGVKEIIIEGVTGHLIFDNYVKNLSKYILELYDDKNKIKNMAENSKNRIEEKFSERNTASDMDRYYSESVNNR